MDISVFILQTNLKICKNISREICICSRPGRHGRFCDEINSATYVSLECFYRPFHDCWSNICFVYTVTIIFAIFATKMLYAYFTKLTLDESELLEEGRLHKRIAHVQQQTAEFDAFCRWVGHRMWS